MAVSAVTLGNSHMKGKSRHLFWPLLAYLLFTVVINQTFFRIAPLLMNAFGSDDKAALAVVFAIARTLLSAGGWFVLFALYGWKSSGKTYRTLFIVLACVQIPDAAGLFLTTWNIMNMIAGYGRGNPLMAGAGTALNYLTYAAWVACLAVFLFSRSSGTALRISAALLILYYLYIAAFDLSYNSIMQLLVNTGGMETYTLVSGIFSVVNSVAYLAAAVFFFASVSFGKQKQPKTPLGSGSMSASR